MKILQEWIENVMGKTEYFNVIEQYFVYGNKISMRFKNDKGMIATLAGAAI